MRRMAWLLCLTMIPGGAASAPAKEGGIVQGRIVLTVPDGRSVPGEWIRLLLVTEVVNAEAIVAAAEALTYEPGVRLNRIHLDFFKAVSRHIRTSAEYVAATSVSTEDGAFAFPPVAPGSYRVLVAFPALIDGHKVAWQVPVQVKAGKSAEVDLENHNLLGPLPDPSQVPGIR